jgi:hypothetical protein
MGICPDSFGPHFWAVFHISCLGTKHVKNLISFIHAFKLIIPCGQCRREFIQYIDDYQIPETDNSLDVFYWSVDIHNIVNKKLKKPEIDYEMAYKKWMSGCPEDCPVCPKQKTDRLSIKQDFSGFLL